MEPDVMPLPSYSPPPLDADSDDGVGSEEDEFGDFSTGRGCSPLGHADVMEPVSHQPDPSFNRLAEQAQHTAAEEAGSRNPDSSLHYWNGQAGEDPQPGALSGSSVEETGFADFTLFTEQAGHPWCCGFTEQRGGRVDERECDAGREVVMESEPRSQHVCKANGGDCEKRHAALVQPPQDHRRPQEDEGNIRFGPAEEKLNIPGKTPALAAEEPAADRASCRDGRRLEGASAELEANVSSLTSQHDQSDWEQVDDEEEIPEDCGDSDAPRCNATQETSATSCQPHTREKRACFADINAEGHGEPVEAADTGVRSLGTLPPSDSFADFCSAPTQDDEGGPTWADFTDRSGPADGRTWTEHREPVDGQDGVTRMKRCQVLQLLQSSFPEIWVPAVEGEEDLPNLGALLHTQQPPETEEEIPELSHALRIQQLMFSPPEDIHCSLGLQFKWGGSHSNTILLRCLGMDPRNSVFIGTKKQALTVPAFASSLVSPLTIYALGWQTQPSESSALFNHRIAANPVVYQGMLDPTKDPSPAACSPGRTAVTPPSGPRVTQKPSMHSVQELPWNQPDWSCRGLSSSQEVCSSLNLDYFGSEDESRSSSSSSRASSPPPGVDRELYELIISKLETGNKTSQREDTLNRLMSAAESTSVSTRKPSAQGELSEEAGRMISELPDLSFMQAKVLMFPIFLAPKAQSSPKLP
ncbi:aftiphilin isoform 2-T4 [Anableps anableps]